MSRAELVEAFASFPARLARPLGPRRRVATASRTASGARSETVRHLIAVEDEVWRSRLARVAAEDDPHWTWTEPGLGAGLRRRLAPGDPGRVRGGAGRDGRDRPGAR